MANKKTRKKCTVGKRVSRQVTAEAGSSLCNYCRFERGSEIEHIWAVEWADKYPQETADFFSGLLSQPVDIADIFEHMKAHYNVAKSCPVCNQRKGGNRAGGGRVPVFNEKAAVTPERRVEVAMHYFDIAKIMPLDGTIRARLISVELGKIRGQEAKLIASMARTRDESEYKPYEDENGEMVFPDNHRAKARAKVRRKVRGRAY